MRAGGPGPGGRPRRDPAAQPTGNARIHQGCIPACPFTSSDRLMDFLSGHAGSRCSAKLQKSLDHVRSLGDELRLHRKTDELPFEEMHHWAAEEAHSSLKRTEKNMKVSGSAPTAFTTRSPGCRSSTDI